MEETITGTMSLRQTPLNLYHESENGFIDAADSIIRREVIQCYETIHPSHPDVLTIGFRCAFCRNAAHRAANSSFRPRSLKGIYREFLRFKSNHFPQCVHIPEDIRGRVALVYVRRERARQGRQIIGSSTRGGGNKAWWVTSAKKAGLEDRRDGLGIAIARGDGIGN